MNVLLSLLLLNSLCAIVFAICPEYCKYKSKFTKVKPGIRVRKDVKCFTKEEWDDFYYAAQELHKQGFNDRYNDVHIKYFAVIHDTAQFLPWHRWFIFNFENEMRKIRPNVTIPYWDGTYDFSAPGLSEIFNDTRFGGMGDPFDNYCVKTGLVANWHHTSPTKTCLKRNFGPNGRYSVGIWHSPEWLTHLFQSDLSYDDFREGVEFSIHSLMHGNVGGPEGDLMWPWGVNDALFFLLHGNIDRIWAKWQKQSNENTFAFNGPKRDFATNYTTQDASVYDIMDGHGIPVKTVMALETDILPYTYDELIGDEGDKRELTAAEQRLLLLPPYMLQRYYPVMMRRKPTKFEIDFAPPCWSQKEFPMPQPVQMAPFTLASRGFNAERAMIVQADSNRLIQRLNMENYLSPYVQ